MPRSGVTWSSSAGGRAGRAGRGGDRPRLRAPRRRMGCGRAGARGGAGATGVGAGLVIGAVVGVGGRRPRGLGGCGGRGSGGASGAPAPGSRGASESARPAPLVDGLRRSRRRRRSSASRRSDVAEPGPRRRRGGTPRAPATRTRPPSSGPTGTARTARRRAIRWRRTRFRDPRRSRSTGSTRDRSLESTFRCTIADLLVRGNARTIRCGTVRRTTLAAMQFYRRRAPPTI